VPSKNRSAALGRYLVALSRSLDNKEKPSVRRRRLHLLYVINDVLHHVKTKLGGASFGDALEAHLPVLVATVAEFKDCPKHMKKLALLLDIWETKAYVSPAHLATLRKAAAGDPSTTVPAAEAQSVASSLRISKEAPYTLPSYHGDPSTPWYDLPAATWLPHITPNSTRPMLPDLVKPIQLAPGPADPKLVAAVRDLLRDVEVLFSKERKADEEPYDQINELGEQVYLDEVTGDVIGGRTYYGWSRTFCEKMKERQRIARNGKHRGRSRSLSSSLSSTDSRDLSRSPSGTPAFKRRRRSPDSRSPPPRGRSRSSLYEGDRGRRGSSSGRSRSRSPYLRRPYNRSPSRSRSRSPGRSRLGSQVHPPSPRSQQHQQAPPPPPSLNQMGLPAGNLPPPPRPPGWNGPWPPPLPSPNATPGGWMPGMMIPQNMMAPNAWSGGTPPPPPPHVQNDPQSHYHHGGYGQRDHQDRHHWQHHGQGRGYGRGGGSWGRGRGRGWL